MDKLTAKIAGINLSSNNFRIRDLDIENPYLKLINYGDEMNLFTFLDALENDEHDSTEVSTSYFFSSGTATINSGRFVYYDIAKQDVPYGMNYDDLDFFNINAAINGLRTIGGVIKMNIDSLVGEEKSGFRVYETTTELTVANDLLRLDNVQIATQKSSLDAEYLNFSYTPGTKAWKNFIRAVMIDYKINHSKVNLHEISIFNENLKGYHETLIGSGHITGTVENMLCEDLHLKTYENTEFVGELSMNGLPNVDETFVDAKINHLQTTLNDLEKISIPNYENGHLSFSDKFKKLGLITAKGRYTGFLSDFVFYGQLFSSYGNVKTDISIKPTAKTKQLELSGKIITEDYKIGDLLENKMLGDISLNVDIVNAMANENYNSYAEIEGTVNKLEVNNYSYENIKIDGLLADKIFDGNVKMNDEHITFDFKGNIDLHEDIPKMNFSLALDHARLSKLNLNRLSHDSLATVSFNVTSHIDGGNIDNATGDIRIYDFAYANSKGKLQADTISIVSSLNENNRTLYLNSEYIEAHLSGDFKTTEIPTLPMRLLSNYIDVGYLNLADSLHIDESSEVKINFKNINPVLNLFYDDYALSENAILSAYYTLGNSTKMQLNFNADYLKFGDKAFHKINFSATGDHTLNNKLTISRINLTDDYNILFFTLDNNVANNQMTTNIHWGDKRLPYDGSISLSSILKEIDNKQISVENKIAPTKFTLNNKKWSITESKLVIDSTNIAIKEFKIKNKKESIEVDGLWSKNKTDYLNVNLKAFETGYLWNMFVSDDIKLSAKMSGYVKYQQNDDAYTLDSDLRIPKLIVENQNFGMLNVNSDWIREKQALQTVGSLTLAEKELLTINGLYGMNDNSLNYALNLDDFDLKLFSVFTNDFLSNIEGTINGKLTSKGNVENPIIDGKLNFDIPNITITETGVPYHLNETITVNNSQMLFENFKIFDEREKTATLNGKVLLGMNNNSEIDLKLTTENFRVLRDSYQPLAYGDAKITSDLNITGDFSHISVRGDVSTDSRSKIIVPYGSASEVSDNEFITFINPADSIKYLESNDILFIPTGAKSPISFNVDFSIDPTSEIQVVLEANNGSTLKSQGSADLFVRRDREGKQYVMGQYTVSQGSFYYSLEGIVNKKFILNEGGTIQWNGAPEKAFVNLDAVYQLKTSLQPLLNQDNNSVKQRQTLVVCKTHITGQLEDPKLTFEIDFPNLDNTTKGNIQATLQTTDITKQVLSLLIFNRFTVPEYNPNASGNNNTNALASTTSELLSQQISNILSQFSDDVNIGFIYKPGDDMTQEELGLAISTELLQDRVIISGNFGFSSQDEANRFNDFIGDIDFDIKLNKKGNLKLRAFSHAKDNLYYYENKRNIQGVGIVYNEEFNTFKELIQRYKEKLGWNKKSRKK
ncbi:translocation/assembly module TamB domain-containing protein [Balneicella halophila]|uniref:translocation/assembly module TamB domain-containing protein n=1 Tax=Balneicella halophila TaxID=1537566 RepID=UPI000E304E77|nr:translocation/assembly module TamB domain-containing protein [Balneicella halophila]